MRKLGGFCKYAFNFSLESYDNRCVMKLCGIFHCIFQLVLFINGMKSLCVKRMTFLENHVCRAIFHILNTSSCLPFAGAYGLLNGLLHLMLSLYCFILFTLDECENLDDPRRAM